MAIRPCFQSTPFIALMTFAFALPFYACSSSNSDAGLSDATGGNPDAVKKFHEATEAFRASTVAREVFGDFVFEHLLNTAVQEQVIFDNNCVTDWELSRYFERG